jgi:hypothetical protein
MICFQAEEKFRLAFDASCEEEQQQQLQQQQMPQQQQQLLAGQNYLKSYIFIRVSF